MNHGDESNTHVFRRRMAARENSVGGLVALIIIASVSVRLSYSSRTDDSAAASSPPAANRAEPAGPPRADVAAKPTPAAAPAAAAPKKMSFAATHKHLHDCHGVLTFTPRTVAYRTDETDDSFEYSIDAVSLDKDGFEAKGKPWHFKVPGQDVDRLFGRWKAGTLFKDGRGPGH